MKLNVYSIYDTAVGAYMRPFFLQSDGQAQRMFKDLVQDKEHDVGKHPEDYSLVRIGSYNDQKGKLEPEDVEALVTGLEMVAASREVSRANLELVDQEIEQNAQ